MAPAEDTMWVVTEVAPYRDSPAGVHGVLAQAATALCQLATSQGLRPEPVAAVASVPPRCFEQGGVLALFTIGETPFEAAQRQAITTAWRAGNLAVLGVHSATDACHGWDDYGRLLGGRFAGHPWTVDFEVTKVQPQHPATAGLPERFAWHDELYLFDHLDEHAQVLLEVADPAALDMAVEGARIPPSGFPLAWCLEDPGRTFYSALGHFPAAWESPFYLKLLADGLSWLTGGRRH
jgi:type 1 glutamine amidotransferase